MWIGSTRWQDKTYSGGVSLPELLCFYRKVEKVMSFARKVIRNSAKAALKERGFHRPNKLAYHMEHRTNVYKMAVDRLTDLHLYGRSKKRRSKRRLRA